MRHLTSMELTDEEKIDQILPIPMSKKPDFPCGLRICLTEKEFEKLGLDPKQAEIGGLVHLFAMARVTSVNQNRNSDDEECCRVEMQIEDMEIESEDEEDEGREEQPGSRYGGKRY